MRGFDPVFSTPARRGVASRVSALWPGAEPRSDRVLTSTETLDAREEGSRSARRARLALALLVLVHVGAAILAAHPTLFPAHFPGDLNRVMAIVEDDGRPWLDREVEYPPLLVGELQLLVGASRTETLARFALAQLVLEGVVVSALIWGWGRRAAVAWLLITLPLLWFPFHYQRTDLLSVALATLGLAALVRRGGGLAGGVLAAAAFAKLWPMVLVPVIIIRRSLRGACAFLLVALLGMGAWLAYGGLGGPGQVVGLRGATGFQIESLSGSLVMLATGEEYRVELDAARVGHPSASVRWALSGAGLILAGGAWLLAERRRRNGVPILDEDVVPLTSVGALLVTATLLSPQFVLWLVPWLSILASRLSWTEPVRSRAANVERALVLVGAVVVALAAPLMAVHPHVEPGDPGFLLLAMRNLALSAIVALGFLRLLLGDAALGSVGQPDERTRSTARGSATPGSA